jgi:hypothetical protein
MQQGPHEHAGVPGDELIWVGGHVTILMQFHAHYSCLHKHIKEELAKLLLKVSETVSSWIKFSFMLHQARSLETITDFVASCLFMVGGKFLFVFLSTSTKS